MAGDIDKNKKGFSGLSGLASEVSGVDEPIKPEPKTEPKPSTPKQPPQSKLESASSEPKQKATTSSPSIKTVSSGKSDSGAVGKWILCIIGIIYVIVPVTCSLLFVGGHSNKKTSNISPSSSHSYRYPQSNPAPTVRTPSSPQSSGLQCDRPPTGTDNLLSLPQLRWCIREEIRLETLRNLIDTDAGFDEFNNSVDEFNSRCASFRYRQGSLEIAKREVEQYRTTIESEVKIEHAVQGLKASEGPAITIPPGSSALIQALCTDVIFPGAILDWKVFDSSGICKNQGELKIIFVENEYFSAIQNNIHNKSLLTLNGSINNKEFKLFNPKWNELWQGECDSGHINGHIYIGIDQKKYFNFTLIQKGISQTKAQ